MNSFPAPLRICLFTLLGLSVLAEPASDTRVLFNFEEPIDVASVLTEGAQGRIVAARAGRVLRVDTGVGRNWPGVTLPAPSGGWDLTRFAAVSMRVRNLGSNSLSLN